MAERQDKEAQTAGHKTRGTFWKRNLCTGIVFNHGSWILDQFTNIRERGKLWSAIKKKITTKIYEVSPKHWRCHVFSTVVIYVDILDAVRRNTLVIPKGKIT